MSDAFVQAMHMKAYIGVAPLQWSGYWHELDFLATDQKLDRFGLGRIALETGIASTVRSSHADCVPWASGISLLHRPHPGRMAGAKLAIAAGICLVDVNMALA